MREAKKDKAEVLVGKYRKTEKNEAIERIFKECNFEKKTTDREFILWEYNFAEKGIPEYPDWFTILKKGK